MNQVKPNWPKCPKCKSQNTVVIELWKGHEITWDMESKEDEGFLNPGDPYRVEGQCKNCDYKWKFRNISQIQPEWFDAK